VRLNDASFPTRIVRCPGCGGESLYAPSNPSRPFCSARCRNNDFGAWASDSYAIEAGPGAEDPGSDDDENN
jgi:uncharacterized protein